MRKVHWLAILLILAVSGILVYEHKKRAQGVYVPQNTSSTTSTLTSKDILTLINAERTKAGVAQLIDSPALDTTAMTKCQDEVTNNYYAHVSPTGKQWSEFIQSYFPHATAGENLAKGAYTSADSVVNDWVNSPEHYANIVSSNYQITGIAICDVGGIYDVKDVVEHFASVTTCNDGYISPSDAQDGGACSSHQGVNHF